MDVRTFEAASWSQKVTEELSIFGLQGLEFSEFGSDHFQMKTRAINEAFERVGRIFGEFGCWVISGHSARQPNSRIVRYKKFFAPAGLAASAVPEGAEEWAVQEETEVRFFGVIKRSAISEEEFMRLCHEFKTTWLVISKDPTVGKRLPELLVNGWSASSSSCPKELLGLARDCNIILVRDFGLTEDFCGGAVVIGNQKLIDRIMMA